LIKNRVQLVENGSSDLFRRLRSDVCDIFEAGLRAVDPEKAIYNSLRLEAGALLFEGGSLDLGKIDRIFVIGGGKAGGLMAKAVENLLGDRISSGVINVLEGTEDAISLDRICLNGASHPVPSQSGVKGVKQMLELTERLSEDDIVITLISGGGSALMPLPMEGISLDDLQDVTGKLLRSGATINELNAVRKHLSGFKGGRLARHCSPAYVLSLILSDVINDPLDTIASGPTAPDDSTYVDAFGVLEKYGFFDEMPEQVKSCIRAGIKGELPETPKRGDIVFNHVYNVLVANNSIAAKAAKRKAEDLGYNSMVLSTSIEGEARQVGVYVSDIAKEIIKDDRPQRKPAAIILGGETTVTVKGSGTGGRNLELALSASLSLDCISCLIATLGTDGIDGPTEAAGAFIDGTTLKRADQKELDPVMYLENNDSYSFFREIGDIIITGPTGTNVNDLALILVI